MKNVLLILSIVLLFSALLGTGNPIMASETDSLINKLIEKGIITEQEAREIKKEEQKVEEQRQEKIVKEIQDKELAVPKGLKGLDVEMLGYVDFSNGVRPESNDGESDLSKFSITRGYVTIKKEIMPWLHARVTMDTHQDKDEDWKVRLKYYYAELRPLDFGFLTDMKSEIGLGHIPWLDFEEHINPYRCQGTMAIERAGILNSADMGVSLRGYFGGKLVDSEETIGSHHYNGRYGSWHLGFYNGSGYHADENNSNKPFEARITLRPLPDAIPGLQVSYFGIFGGKGNDDSNPPAGTFPDYGVNMGMLSYQNPWLTTTGQVFTTQGNKSGTWVDAQGDALETKGYSMFGNLKLPVFENKLSLFGRYDYFDQDADSVIASDADYDMYVGGLAYDIYKGNLIILVYETTDYGRNAGKKGKSPVPNNNLGDDEKVQLVLQIKF